MQSSFACFAFGLGPRTYHRRLRSSLSPRYLDEHELSDLLRTVSDLSSPERCDPSNFNVSWIDGFSTGREYRLQDDCTSTTFSVVVSPVLERPASNSLLCGHRLGSPVEQVASGRLRPETNGRARVGKTFTGSTQAYGTLSPLPSVLSPTQTQAQTSSCPVSRVIAHDVLRAGRMRFTRASCWSPRHLSGCCV